MSEVPPPSGGSGWSRRRLLGVAGRAGAGVVGLAAAGYVGWRLPRQQPPADPRQPESEPGGTGDGITSDGADHYRFRSRPDLRPPVVAVTADPLRVDRTGAEFFFLAPVATPNAAEPPDQLGPMIVDRAGELVWAARSEAGRSGLDVHDFRTQSYRGEPVLTWWEGEAAVGYGQGVGVILDRRYRRIATVKSVGEVGADLHDVLLTDRGTAYLTLYRQRSVDLSAVGGSKDGRVLTGVVQEIDIASGELLFEWDSLDHVPVTATDIAAPEKADAAMDYFHINSVAEISPDELLISARNCHAVYSVAKPSGRINWILGGKQSDFTLDDRARFHFQHTATMIDRNRMLIFDNEAAPVKGPQSRAIVLNLDRRAQTVALDAAYTHPSGLLADYLGSAQQLSNGNIMVGWGAQPYFSEFSGTGQLLLDGRLPDNVMSYRITAHDWTGEPTEPPAVAVGAGKVRGTTVYASWNGATRIDRWQARAGTQKTNLNTTATIPATGFETAIAINHTGPYFQAVALDADGNELGHSAIIKATR